MDPSTGDRGRWQEVGLRIDLLAGGNGYKAIDGRVVASIWLILLELDGGPCWLSIRQGLSCVAWDTIKMATQAARQQGSKATTLKHGIDFTAQLG